MMKLDELIKKRASEIEAEEEKRRNDEDNYQKAIRSGIIGAILGGLAGLVVGFVLGAVVGFIADISGGNKSTPWGGVLFFGSIIVGAIIGYYQNFSSTRRFNN